MAPSAEADAPACLRRYPSKRLPAKYADALTHDIVYRADVTFIPSSDALRTYRRDARRRAAGPCVFAVIFVVVAIGHAWAWFLIPLAVVWVSVAIVEARRAVHIGRTPDVDLPPMGLSLWDDALVAYLADGRVTVVPRSAIRACNTAPGDHGSGLSLTALDRRGDTPPKTIGWFDMDSAELRMTVDAWLARTS